MSARGPLRLLAVMASLQGGGAERQQALLLRHVDRTRFEPTLCLLTREGALLAEIPSEIPVVDLEKRNRWDAPRLVAALARLMHRTRPDVVLSRVDYTNIISVAASRLTRPRPPIVAVEDSLQSAELAHLSHSGLRRTLLRWAYRRASVVVAPSPGVLDDLARNLGITPAHTRVIPNMVELAALNSTRGRADGAVTTPTVVTAGRLVPSKGHETLLAALALVTSPWKLLVVGDGPLRTDLQRRARELSIDDRVTFAGFVEDPFAAMAASTVFVSASHWESFGNVLIEAMALGLPVVSTRVPAGPEWLIEDGRTGLLARPRDPRDLADKIERVLTDEGLRRRLIAGGLEEVQRFDVAPVTSAYEATLEQAARRSVTVVR